MTPNEEEAANALMRVVGNAIEQQDDELAHQSEWLLRWLAADLRAGQSQGERVLDEQDGASFARTTAARLASVRAQRALPRRTLVRRAASMVGTVEQVRHIASAQGAVVMLDLAAAAGAGRALWGETCDSWLELPPDIPTAPYVALRVAGDSMVPVLAPRDVILVKLDAPHAVDDMVVARLPDDGYVVKRVARITRTQLTLASFNPEFEPIVVDRDPATVLGTVIARFSRSE